MSLNSKISKRKIEIVSSEQVNHEVLSELVDIQKNANVNIINDDEIYVSVNSNTKFSEVVKIYMYSKMTREQNSTQSL